MKFKFRHADKIVGAFTLLALFFICFLLIMVGRNKRWFEEDIYYRSQFLTADGLTEGMGIKLIGFKIGEIKSVTINDKSLLVDVSFIIYNQYIDRITPGSVLELINSPLGGGLNIYPGKEPGSPPETGAYIPSSQFPEGKRLIAEELVQKPDKSDIVSDLMRDLPTLIKDVDKTVITVNNLLYTIDQSLAGNPEAGPIPEILYGVSGTMEEIEGIASSLNHAAYSVSLLLEELEDPENLLPRLAGDQGLAGAVFSDNSEVYKSINVILSEITLSLKNVEKLTGSLSELSPQIALLLKEATITLDEAEDVLEGLKNNPLLRGGVSQEEDPTEAVGAEIRDNEF